MDNLITIFISMAIINNFIVARFLGLCPFFGVSKKLREAISMGGAVTFVMLIASVSTWVITNYILIPLDVLYMRIVVYILVIATLVQIVELTIKRTNLTLYNAFGIYLPLITTNCAILGITLINFRESYSLIESIVAALGGGIGFAFILTVMSGIREKLELADCPRAMKGLPIAIFVAMLLGLIFFGFGGIV
ncbi:MAG: RnfABCDGE type electron transport complex subunit A [Dehalococcoidales bacterium]